MPSFEPVTASLRVLNVLLALNRLKEASLADLFREVELSRPTIIRMLETLIHAGFVLRHPVSGRYLPTGRTLQLSSGFQRHEEMGLAAAAVLTGLHRDLGWPSDVAVFDGDAMLVSRTSRQEGVLHFNRRVGYRAPLLGTSLGLAYLAFCDLETRDAALASLQASNDPWDAAARDPDRLRDLLADIRGSGYATMDDHYSARAYSGVASAIGVPILLGERAAGSLNLMYLRHSLDEAQVASRYGRPLRAAADRIATALEALRSGTRGR